MAGKTDRDAADDPRAIVTSRVIDAPRALVFEAWTDPRHLAQWWGPNGFTTTTMAFDFRPGGVWRFVMHGPDGRDYQNRITFEKIVKPERIEYRHDGDEDVEFRSTIAFEDQGGKTRITIQALFSTAQERERVARDYGAVEGAEQHLARLADYVANWTANGGLAKSVTVTRVIAAPRALAFEAFTEAKHLAEWWGPKGFANPVCEIDARPGGAILIHMQGPGDFSHPMTGTVHEVVPLERFVFTAVARDAAGTPLLESHTTVTFRDEGAGTLVTVEARAKGFVDVARLMLAGMKEGWSQSLEKLGAMFARR